MVQVDERTVEAVPEVGAAGAGTVFVVGPEHDVVGEELRAAVEQLREGLLALLGVELVLLLDRHPRELEPLLLDLLVSLRLLGLELRELIAGRLPFLASSDLVLRHLLFLPLGNRSRHALDRGAGANSSAAASSSRASAEEPFLLAEVGQPVDVGRACEGEVG